MGELSNLLHTGYMINIILGLFTLFMTRTEIVISLSVAILISSLYLILLEFTLRKYISISWNRLSPPGWCYLVTITLTMLSIISMIYVIDNSTSPDIKYILGFFALCTLISACNEAHQFYVAVKIISFNTRESL